MRILMVVSKDSESGELSQKNTSAIRCMIIQYCKIEFIVLYPVRDIPFRVIHSYSNPSQAGREL